MNPFARHAQDYVTSPVHARGASLARLVELARPLPDWRVLDVATGGGHAALAFAPRVRRVLATDVTQPMLRAARAFVHGQGARNIAFCQAEASALPCPSAGYDLVTCRLALHHFPAVGAALREWARALRPGGLVGLADNVVPADPEAAQAINALERARDPSHVRAYTLAELLAALAAEGIEVLHAEAQAKTLDFADWVARIGAGDPDGLRARLFALPPAALAVLRPREADGRTAFDLVEAVVLARVRSADERRYSS